jgi:hypothetical protein
VVGIKSIPRGFVFVIGGIIAIIVGSFMIRGTMHLWDKPQPKNDDET